MTHNKFFSIKFVATVSVLTLIFLNNPSQCMSIKLTTMDTTSSDTTISTYNTDVGDCSCDVHQSSCDIFCCCDTSCSNSQTQTWSTNDECLNTDSAIETSCNQLSKGGFFSFEDLACVYYSNRGNISYFYSYPDSGSVNYPTPAKFVSVVSSSAAINALTTTATTGDYSASQYLMKTTNGSTLKYFEIWSPVARGSCDVGYVNISQSQTYSCEYELSPTTCVANTALFSGTIKFCLNGSCSSTSNLQTITQATTDNVTCYNMITQQSIAITVSSSGSSYSIDSITVTLTQSNISLSNINYQIKTTVTVTNPSSAVSYSGYPGYMMGKSVKMLNSAGTYKLYDLADSSGNCVTTGSSTVDLLFGQNAVYSCVSSNPCGSSLYIDQIAKETTLNFTKWARGSTDIIQLSGTSASLNTCSKQTIEIQILYTNAGWVADMQNYIIGAELSTQSSTQSTWNRKYLKINWVFVDPSTISTPPTNYFYSYFSYLWKPLREYFGVY